MTAFALKRVVAEALAEVGANVDFMRLPKGKPRTTTWLGIEHGFGIRHYASGRKVYIVQTRMAGRLRTITIGSAAVITRYQATMVARRVIAYAQVGLDPAAERKRIRGAPRFDDFLEEYWRRWSPHWKLSTLISQEKYRRLYLDDAFPDIFIDALNEADVTKWFADLNNRVGPGGANRVMSILNNMLNKAESW
ncbi:integrase arm-type DNA-binding domain-containing protein [Sandaracinobacteroides hominis]|uniref:integrase arm-type DNA-binding domain-containing protein n=1 Tax=Sandaracinobacteroides hominis TaxID=2780086 RepID=UPI0018F5A0A1|nr:integrase arm-type DNA-binding domain-containing protein [Sandaracinobacteroides hominis]